MKLNPLQVQMSSETSSLKIWLEGSGSLTVPPTNSTTHTTNFIPHEFLSDNLIWQVGFVIAFVSGGTTTGQLTPWTSGDGQTSVVATLDSNFLYISGFAESVGSTTLQFTVDYAYRLLVP